MLGLQLQRPSLATTLTAFAAAGVVVAIDQASKHAVVDGLGLADVGSMTIAPFLNFRMAWNTGVDFGLLSGHGPLARGLLIAGQSLLAVVVLVAALQQRRVLFVVALGVAAGGAVGNIIDRWVWGAVADFINVACCGVNNPWSFNLADVGVFGGFALLLLPTRTTANPLQGTEPETPKAAEG